MKFLLFIAFLILMGTPAVAQLAAMPVSEWVKRLSDPGDKKNEASRLLLDSVVKFGDSSKMNRLLQQLQAKENSNNTYFKTRLNLFKALVVFHKDALQSDMTSKATVMKLMKQAMQQANETNDDYLVAYTSWVYSFISGSYNEPDLSVMYAMYSAELYEKLFGTNELPSYNFLAAEMFRLREYDKCKRYCLKWLSLSPVRETKDQEVFRMILGNNKYFQVL